MNHESTAVDLGARATAPAPVSAAEETLLTICHELLGSVVRAEDDFFDLGGTSIQLARLLQLANERLHTNVDIGVIAEGVVIRHLARHFVNRNAE